MASSPAPRVMPEWDFFIRPFREYAKPQEFLCLEPHETVILHRFRIKKSNFACVNFIDRRMGSLLTFKDILMSADARV
jgi:hypothetical protein